jgi:hypothetical protein
MAKAHPLASSRAQWPEPEIVNATGSPQPSRQQRQEDFCETALIFVRQAAGRSYARAKFFLAENLP